jgi:recombination protein RecT
MEDINMSQPVPTNNPNTQERKKNFSLAMETDAYKNLIAQTIPDEKQRNRFKAAILSAVAVNPTLRECEAGTILAAAFLGESLGLSPSPQLGQYYMLPFKNAKKSKDENRDVSEAVFVLGYKGYVQMSVRSGAYKDIIVESVKESELVKYNALTGEIIFNPIMDEIKREAAKTIGYYAKIILTSGFEKGIYWSKEKMQIHADKYSKAYSMAADIKLKSGQIPEKDLWKYSSFWYKDFDIMAHKTMIRQIISKWGVMSQELSDAYVRDDAVIYQDGSYDISEIGLADGSDNLIGKPDEPTQNNQKPSDDDINKQGIADNVNSANEDEAENITFDEL